MSDHAKEKHTREITEYLCKEPGCAFFNEVAQQGVCHSTDSVVDGQTLEFVEAAEKEAESHLAWMKEHNTEIGYVERLEGEVICLWMNNQLMLDEVVRLRARVALLAKGIVK